MPSFPREDDYTEFTIDRATRYRFFVDISSVRVDTDGVVRYAVVARSSSGVENISFEGIRCQTREFTIYAFGSPDQTWSQVRNRKWARIEKSRDNDHRYSLLRYYLCTDGSPRKNVGEAIQALQRGHPEAARGH